MYVKDAASVLDLQSDVGPLGDITVKPRVAQDFDLTQYSRPSPSRTEYGLDVVEYVLYLEGGDSV